MMNFDQHRRVLRLNREPTPLQNEAFRPFHIHLYKIHPSLLDAHKLIQRCCLHRDGFGPMICNQGYASGQRLAVRRMGHHAARLLQQSLIDCPNVPAIVHPDIL
jgi:hypothetical protein